MSLFQASRPPHQIACAPVFRTCLQQGDLRILSAYKMEIFKDYNSITTSFKPSTTSCCCHSSTKILRRRDDPSSLKQASFHPIAHQCFPALLPAADHQSGDSVSNLRFRRREYHQPLRPLPESGGNRCSVILDTHLPPGRVGLAASAADLVSVLQTIRDRLGGNVKTFPTPPIMLSGWEDPFLFLTPVFALSASPPPYKVTGGHGFLLVAGCRPRQPACRTSWLPFADVRARTRCAANWLRVL
jgi:hypothetical protein